jgi:hypothetical protein
MLRIAAWHRLAPMLYCHLSSDADTPASVLEQLERAYLANVARSLFIAAALRDALGALSAADVPALLLKGAALVETVYADPAQREMLDLDILVPGAQLHLATAALESLGYAPQAAGHHSDNGQRGTRVVAHHDSPLVGETQLVAVELHRHISLSGEGSGFDIDDVWRRARSSASGEHLLPAPEDLLLHVCLHFTRNRLGGSYRRRNTGGALGQICDIARLVQRARVDWATVVDCAGRYHLDSMVFLALFAARDLGVAVPEAPLEQLRPPRFSYRLGHRLVSLRVLRADDHLPVRSARWMFAPSREVLVRGWRADPAEPLSLVRAYVRRARAHAPLIGSALRRPWTTVQDHRLNGQIYQLESRD